MGDLEDAIREHLELKRRRGADPAEVAREEHEALAPVTRSHPVIAQPIHPGEPDAHEFAVPAAMNGVGDATRRFVITAPTAVKGDDTTQEFAVEVDGMWLADDE